MEGLRGLCRRGGVGLAVVSEGHGKGRVVVGVGRVRQSGELALFSEG